MRRIPALLAALLLTGCAPKIVQNAPAPADDTVYTRETAGIRAEDDFYGYTNFDFLYTNDIPAGMNEYGSLRLLGKRVDDLLTEEIRALAESAAQYPADSAEQKIKDLYLQYLDGDTRERVGISPLEKGFEAIRTAGTAEGFARACGTVYTEYGVTVLPAGYVMRDEYDSGRYSVYLGQMDLMYPADELQNGRDTAESLQIQLTKILERLGHDNAGTLAYDTVTMLLDISEQTADTGKMSVEERYNVRRPGELDPLMRGYLEAAGLGGRDIIVMDTAQLEKVCALLTDDNLPLWKALAECSLLYAYRSSLPEEYSAVFGAEGSKSAEEKAVDIVKGMLTDEVGSVYSRKHLDEKTSAAVKAMTEDIIAAYGKCIESSALLTENDRRECLAKIENITVNIGCPDEERHSGSKVAGSLLESAVSIKSTAVTERFGAIDSAPSPTEWDMPPQTVNAVYDPSGNSITIPMALFSAPVFDAEADYYTNLGGLGSIIAHETGHAFDAEGILCDEHGNYRPDRISPDRTDLLNESVSRYFGSRRIMDTFFIDGELTKAENAADLSGMQVICSMTDDPAELKRIFKSYAALWATLSFDTDAAAQITEDVHSPAEIRVNAVLSGIDKFYEVYGIKETDGMYVPPEERVRVW